MIKALGEHDYLIRVLEGEDMIEIRVHASQAVLGRLPVDTEPPGRSNRDFFHPASAGRRHGQVAADSIRAHYKQSQQILDRLGALGISYDEVVQKLEDDAVAKFDGAWDQLAERLASTLHAQPGAAAPHSG